MTYKAPRTYDFDRAILERLYDMQEKDPIILHLPVFQDSYDGDGNLVRTETAFVKPDDGSLGPRDFQILAPGEDTDPDQLPDQWVSWEPGSPVFDSGLGKTDEWSMRGGGMIRLCAFNGEGAYEAMLILAGRVAEQFRTGVSIPVPVLQASGGSAPALNMVFLTDPAPRAMIDDQRKIVVVVPLEYYGRQAPA